jgi:histidinol-phosphate aminotransferase
MARFARHLQDHTIQNPFQGIVRLEQKLGHPVATRIGSNESMPIDSPALMKLLGPAGCQLARSYPDPYAHALRKLAAGLNQLEDEQVLFDSGADSLILLALRLYCNAGDTVVVSAGSYPAFRYFADGCGTRVVEVSLRTKADQGLEADLGGLACAAYQHKARLVYLANPDNPTGQYYSQSEIERFRHSLPGDCLLVLDEAYLEFAEPGKALSQVLPATLRLRTLSKAYALAGLRIGYAIASADIIAKADQIRPQFALSSLAQAAATIALQDQEAATKLLMSTISVREILREKLLAYGLNVPPTWTNFVSVHYTDSSRSESIQRQLFNQGIAVHRPTHPAVSHLLRITADSKALSEAVLSTLGFPGQ